MKHEGAEPRSGHEAFILRHSSSEQRSHAEDAEDTEKSSTPFASSAPPRPPRDLPSSIMKHEGLRHRARSVAGHLQPSTCMLHPFLRCHGSELQASPSRPAREVTNGVYRAVVACWPCRMRRSPYGSSWYGR